MWCYVYMIDQIGAYIIYLLVKNAAAYDSTRSQGVPRTLIATYARVHSKFKHASSNCVILSLVMKS